MKNHLTQLIASLVLFMAFNSCNDSFTEEPDETLAELKAAKVKYTTCIIQLDRNDPTNKDRLGDLNLGYELNNAEILNYAPELLKKYNVKIGEIGKTYGNSIWGFSVEMDYSKALELESKDEILKVSRNSGISATGKPVTKKKPKPTPTPDPIPSDGQIIPGGIKMVLGNTSPGEDSPGKKVWIIDSGIASHEDLNVGEGQSFVDYTSSTDDDNGHGTHVAGIIAAKNNDIGIVGVAPGATVIPIKVLNQRGTGNEADALAGIDYVAAYGSSGDVVLLAFTGNYRGYMDSAAVELASKGIKVAIAAGNMRANANVRSPARANHTNIFTVSACDTLGNWWINSNHGNPPIDICAPGVDIYSTSLRGTYQTESGTSMAAAHVAGLLLVGWVGEYKQTVIGDPDNRYYPEEPFVYRPDLDANVAYSNFGKEDPIALLGGSNSIFNYW